MADNTVQTVLQLKIDQSELNKALQGQESARKSLTRISLEVQQADKELGKLRASMGSLSGDALDKANLKAAKFEEQIAKSRAQAQKLVEAFREIPKVAELPQSVQEQYDQLSQRVGLAGDVQSNLGAARGIADMAGLGGVGSAVGGAGEVAALIEELPRLKTAITGMPQVISASAQALGTNSAGLIGTLGIGAIAVVGMSTAVNVFNERIEEGKRNLEAAFSAQETYYGALKSMTSQQVRDEIAERQRVGGILRQQLDETRAAVERGRAQGLPDALNDAYTRFKELENQVNANEKATLRLTQGLTSNTFAANDAAEAEKALTTARMDAAAAYGAEAQARLESVSYSQEQIASELDRINATKANYEAQLLYLRSTGDQSTETSQKVGELVGKLGELGTREDYLLQTALPLAMAREREAKAAEDAKKQTEDLANTLEKVQDAQKRFEDISAAYTARMAEISSELAKARSEQESAINQAISEAQSSRAEIYAKSNDELNEAERAAFMDRAKLSEQHERALQKIIKDGQRNQTLAIEDRDTVALSRAESAQQDATDNENQAYRDRAKEIDDRLREQNRLVSKRMVEQLQAVDVRLQQQTQAAVVRYNQQVQVAQQQTIAAQQAQQKQLSDLRAALMQDANIRNSAYASMLLSSKTFGQGLDFITGTISKDIGVLRNLASGIIQNRSVDNGQVILGGGKVTTPYAAGGNPAVGFPALVNEPGSSGRESFMSGGRRMDFPGMGIFYPAAGGTIDAGRGGGRAAPVINNNITINGSGLNESQLARAVDAGVKNGLQQFISEWEALPA